MKSATLVLVFTAAAVAAGCLLGTLCGSLSSSIAWTAFGIGAVATVLAWQSCPPAGRGRASLWEVLAGVLFALFALRSFCWLVFTDGDSIKVLSPNNLGDLSLHLTFIEHFACGAPFWPRNPIFPAQSLRYHFGVDLLNSLLVCCGLQTLRSLVWVGLGGCVLTWLTLRQWGGAFAVAGFLCAGGLAGFDFFATGELRDYQADLAWKSVPLALFVTQRGFLFALPAGLLLLTSWRTRIAEAHAVRDGPHPGPAAWKLPLWIEILLLGAMPLFHLHTFLALTGFVGWWLLFGTETLRRRAVALLAWSLPPAAMLVWQFTDHFQSGGGLHWQPGWMVGDAHPVWFWLENFGIGPLLVLGMCGILLRERREQPVAWAFVPPALVLLAITLLISFSRWEWDNTKLMLWSWLVLLPFLWSAGIGRLPVLGRAVVVFVLFFSGFISLLGGLDASHTGYPLAQRNELDRLVVPLRGLPVDAVFAACPTYNHPLSLLGRCVVMGYDGHLWSAGIDYAPTLARLEQLMNGADGWREAAAELQADYLFWGPREAERFPASLQPWRKECPRVAAGTWGAIYQLAQERAGPAQRR